jgi:hypothetical protein
MRSVVSFVVIVAAAAVVIIIVTVIVTREKAVLSSRVRGRGVCQSGGKHEAGWTDTVQQLETLKFL